MNVLVATVLPKSSHNKKLITSAVMHVAIMDDFLSAAANSVVCNTFPRQKVVNLKAEKSLQVELGKASCNAIQPVINFNANQCD